MRLCWRCRLLAFFTSGAAALRSPPVTVCITALLLFCASGVIAMPIPYAAEIYPAGQFYGLRAAVLLPLMLAAALLLTTGIETRG